MKKNQPSQTWTASINGSLQPQPALKALIFAFHYTYPSFTRRVDKITEQHAKALQPFMKEVLGRDFSIGSLTEQLSFAVSKYKTLTQPRINVYNEYDRMIASLR